MHYIKKLQTQLTLNIHSLFSLSCCKHNIDKVVFVNMLANSGLFTNLADFN